MARIHLRFLILLLIGGTLAGCAAIAHGTLQKVDVTSSPPGALVMVDGIASGRTPLSVELKRGYDHLLSVDMAGYEKQDLVVTSKISNWVWANVLLTWYGIFGLAIDYNSGAFYDLTPVRLNAELQKAGENAAQQGPVLFVVTSLDADHGPDNVATRAPGGREGGGL